MITNTMNSLDKMKKEFEGLKNYLIKRATPALGEDAVKAFISALEEYDSALREALERENNKSESLRDENETLRSISGVGPVGVEAKLLEKAAENKFLRDQLLAVKQGLDSALRKVDDLSVEKEKLRQDFESSLMAREKERKRHESDIKSITDKLSEFDKKHSEQIALLEKKRLELEQSVARGKKEGRTEFVREYKNVISRVHAMASIISVNAQLCLERIEKSRVAGHENIENKADIENACTTSREITKVLELYLGMLKEVEPKYEKVDLSAVFEKLKARFAEQQSRKKTRIIWPETKSIAELSLDPKIAYEALSCLVDNYLEVSGPATKLDITVARQGDVLSCSFKDNAPAIKPEEIESLFLPVWDTRSGYRNMILSQSRHLAELLGGTVTFEAKGREKIFTISFKSRAPEESK
ncbi:MAG TPA: hypothetical protein DEE98_07250 [Elusimicrobia bacterium]|nr:MAG: hypothetical protein A2278_00115 [Elusimicrobia bacterium RIFOXYA12_FULL_49_49]OGS09213.1 MAG: hypothetical protein A2204_00945 [Elusimicrobia bacterium RIFOXYA1_FULL_47_7]OGS11461.1 MAG: hypothetical protein A2386_00050 [Elusimicrobia bacterium RIFOXYB1_FULL_48_9]OGS15841.1 MAG: hypothetical protein A2251_04250 [Elusimicrobia bacterium RIFOXYA2_FULL_47_53]OGS27135.1 MAG: hypothetical protein A2339_00500 [Elusimicrobia bacterium RIFOXYB12_FULL_50_12]OGS31173.1 MAG: hypothetical protein